MSATEAHQVDIRPRARLLGMLLVLVAFGSACATARTNHFRGFAEAGRTYAEATQVVFEEAGTLAINADSRLLERDREELSEQKRRDLIQTHNRLMRERLQLLGDLQRHARLLSSYFAALAALAASDAPSSMGDVAEGLADSLGKLSPEIETAKVGDLEVSSFAGQITNIVVANFKLAALDAELQARASTIEKELELQEEALNAVAEQMRTDLEIDIGQREFTEVMQPYFEDRSLPRGWAGKRLGVLRDHLVISSLDAAAGAARSLRASFVSLVGGTLTTADLGDLISDLDRVITLIAGVRGDSGGDGTLPE